MFAPLKFAADADFETGLFATLAYGGFSFTKETHTAQVGPLVLKVQEKESVTVPVVLSAAAIALGLFLLVGLRNK